MLWSTAIRQGELLLSVQDLNPTTNVNVTYSGYGLDSGTVTVSITSYQFQFVLPLLTTSISMPSYKTTLPAESAGLLPANL